MIRLENISKSYNEKILFKDFSYEFPKSGFVSVTGPSGRGKTTLVNMILGIETPDSGNVKLEGSISVVFQENCLILQRNVLFNTMLAAKDSINANLTYSKTALEEKAKNILEELGLKDDLSTPIEELSGGMARRVAIARSLCLDADVYIMDEPLAGLDQATRKQVLEVIQKYTSKNGKLLVMVTHDKDTFALSDSKIEL